MAETSALSLDRRVGRIAIGVVMPSSTGQYSIALSLLLVTPLLALLAFGFIYPIGRLIWGSFFGPHISLTNYVRIIEEPLYLRILWRTVAISLEVTLAAFLLGYPVAFAMARLRGGWATIVAGFVLIPLWTSILVRSYAWIVLLQRNGVVNSTLMELGLISQPLHLLYTEGAVVMAMTHVLLPFMIFPIYAALRSIPGEYARAARNLGASAFTAFIRITFPLSLPGVFAGLLLTFILALGFYITPALVGGPRTLMMATLIGQQTTELLDWPFAGALSATLLGATLLLVAAFRKVLSFSRGFEHG